MRQRTICACGPRSLSAQKVDSHADVRAFDIAAERFQSVDYVLERSNDRIDLTTIFFLPSSLLHAFSLRRLASSISAELQFLTNIMK